MQAKVTSKSQYGLRVEGIEGWLNYGNYYTGTKDFEIGDTVNLEYKGKYIKSLSLIAGASLTDSTNETTIANVAIVSDKQAQINRSTATKVAFGGPYFAHLLTTMDHSEATQTARDFADYLVRYISGTPEAATTETK